MRERWGQVPLACFVLSSPSEISENIIFSGEKRTKTINFASDRAVPRHGISPKQMQGDGTQLGFASLRQYFEQLWQTQHFAFKTCF